MKIRNKNIFAFILTIAAIIAVINKSEAVKIGIIKGIDVCGCVIIPSLFPFTVCILLLVNMNIKDYLKPFNKISYFFFGLNGYEMLIFIFSLVGGYPIGAKLINYSCKAGKITSEKAKIMLLFCVNAGPAFIISAIGSGMLGNKQAGLILFASQIISKIVLALIFAPKLKKAESINNNELNTMRFWDNFTLSVTEASTSMVNICSYIILFSGITELIKIFKDNLFGYIMINALEVTNAVIYTKNIYKISFLLGFGGVCVWMQVFSVSNDLKVNKGCFAVIRAADGALSILITKLLITVTKSDIQTVIKNSDLSLNFINNYSLFISMLIMLIIFFAAVYGKNKCGNFKEDLL